MFKVLVKCHVPNYQDNNKFKKGQLVNIIFDVGWLNRILRLHFVIMLLLFYLLNFQRPNSIIKRNNYGVKVIRAQILAVPA